MANGLTIDFASGTKKELETMAEETGFAQAALIKLATISMLENYKQKGSFIFVDLLNPEHKEKRK